MKNLFRIVEIGIVAIAGGLGWVVAQEKEEHLIKNHPRLSRTAALENSALLEDKVYTAGSTSKSRSLQDNCSQGLKNSKELSNTLTLHWDVHFGSSAGLHVLHVCMWSNTEGWLGFGVSPSGKMVGSEAVIGLPDENTVLKYSLNGKGPTSVVAMNATSQTLTNTSIQQDNGVTVLSFGKYLEDGKDPIKLGQNNTFIFAEAMRNALVYHGQSRGTFTLFLDEAPIPTPRPTSMGKSSKLSKSSKVEHGKGRKLEQV